MNNIKNLIDELTEYVGKCESWKMVASNRLVMEIISKYAPAKAVPSESGIKCSKHSHGDICVVTEKNGGWDVSMSCLSTPCIREDGKYHAPAHPTPSTTEPVKQENK